MFLKYLKYLTAATRGFLCFSRRQFSRTSGCRVINGFSGGASSAILKSSTLNPIILYFHGLPSATEIVDVSLSSSKSLFIKRYVWSTLYAKSTSFFS